MLEQEVITGNWLSENISFIHLERESAKIKVSTSTTNISLPFPIREERDT